MEKKKKRRLPIFAQYQLERVVERLNALVETSSTCDIKDEHKKAVRMYVKTWITPDVENILSWSDGQPHDKEY